MWNLTINGIDIYHILNWFIIYSFLGWLWETCFVSAKQGQFVNRGFIAGPFCTIYGCGAVSVYLILKPFDQNLLYLYFGGMAVATVLEYLTAVLMESIFHTSWWDYSDKKFNFQGRICLGASLGWGFFTVILFRVLQPVVDDIVALYPVFEGEIAVCIFGAGYLCDFCFSAASAYRLRERIPQWENALERKQVELMLKVSQQMNSLEFARGVTMETLKDKLTPDILKDGMDSLESLKERFGDADILHSVTEKRKAVMDTFTAEFRSYRNSLADKLGKGTARFFKAYPHLNRGYRLHHNKKDKQ